MQEGNSDGVRGQKDAFAGGHGSHEKEHMLALLESAETPQALARLAQTSDSQLADRVRRSLWSEPWKYQRKSIHSSMAGTTESRGGGSPTPR